MGIWFMHGLPAPVAEKLIKKYSIDINDPDTIEYQTLLNQVLKMSATSKLVQRMNNLRSNAEQQPVADLIEKIKPKVSVTQKQRSAEPVIDSPKAPNVDELAKVFERLSIAVTKLESGMNNGGIVRPPWAGGSAQSQGFPPRNQFPGSAPQFPQNSQGQQANVVNVGAYGASQPQGRGEYGCYYCWNQIEEFPFHQYCNECPWFQRHIARGTAHLNENGR